MIWGRTIAARGAAPIKTAAIVVAALVACAVVPVRAADMTFDPPVGSRWIVETETRGEEVRPEGSTHSLIKARAEFTIEQKTPDGFRVAWVQRDAATEGNARSLPLQHAFAKMLENVVIRASTDLSGKPLRIDNLDEAKGAMRRAAGDLAGQFDGRPAARALFDQLSLQLIEVDADMAASVYLGNLALLAVAQNTGLKPGEFRQTSRPAENPLGGDALMSNERFELTQATAGRLQFVGTTSIDAAAMKEFMQSFARSLLAASGDSVTKEKVDWLVASMVFSSDRRREFEVADGVTQRAIEKTTTVFRGMEQNVTQSEERIVTVTRAQ